MQTHADLSALPDAAFLREKQIVPALVPVSNSTWWRWVKSGKAPAPVKLGPAVTAWRVGDLRRFLSAEGAAQ